MERASEEKHEYFNGEIFSMAGGTIIHSLITANTIRETGNVLKGKPCRVYDSNLRVRIPRSPQYTYPDLTIACEDLEFDPDDEEKHTYLNPTVIVEVLSPSTEAYDRGRKFQQYRKIQSLREYVLIAQDRAVVETFFRNDDGDWVLSSYSEVNATLVLRSVGVRIALAEIYAGVTFPPEKDVPPAEAATVKRP